ncbi:MAG: hypothetical protein LBQ66_14025 [Planctomycetaceae bacterium]|nr:hypothetical protein [Planctomycetaceae bacterium]
MILENDEVLPESLHSIRINRSVEICLTILQRSVIVNAFFNKNYSPAERE